jgi:hypothetical protein
MAANLYQKILALVWEKSSHVISTGDARHQNLAASPALCPTGDCREQNNPRGV